MIKIKKDSQAVFLPPGFTTVPHPTQSNGYMEINQVRNIRAANTLHAWKEPQKQHN